MSFDLPKVGPGAEDSDTDDDEPDLPPTEVEYLNYRAVVQHGLDVDDDDLFEKARELDLTDLDYGKMEVERDETLLRSAEANDLKWASQCRAGTCNVCTGVLKRGDVEMDVNLALEDEEVDRGLRLTCVATPESDSVQFVFNAAPEVEGNPGRGREPPKSEGDD